MSVLTLIAVVVIICLIVWLLQAWSPPAPFRNILYGVLLLVLVLLLLSLFGVLGGMRIR